jgi:hypothetical protein
MASKKSNSRLRYWSNGPLSDMKAEGFTTILVYCVGPAGRLTSTDRRRVFRRQKMTPVIGWSFCCVKPARIFAPPKLRP